MVEQLGKEGVCIASNAAGVTCLVYTKSDQAKVSPDTVLQLYPGGAVRTAEAMAKHNLKEWMAIISMTSKYKPIHL